MMHKVLQSFLRRLTNLTSNNRSLYLPRLINGQYVDVHDFDFLNNESSFKIIEWLISAVTVGNDEGQKYPLCQVIDSRDAGNNQVSERVKKLSRTEKFLYEEQGSKDLYIGWPFVRGKFSDGTIVRCPLMFFPVSLTTIAGKNSGLQWALSLRDDIMLTFNKSFLLAYAHYNQFSIQNELVEKTFDDFDPDSRIFRTSLYKLLKDNNLEINFNQENFIDKLTAFKEFKKADLDKTEKNGVLKLYPEAVLGIFPQAGSYLVPDYLSLIQNESIKDIESFFTSRSIAGNVVQPEAEDTNAEEQGSFQSSAYDFQHRIKEEQLYAPFAMDAYQENVLKAVKKGNSLVVQGPPGTGKSQLIANLIADGIAQGKRILLVSQKKAALDVVYNRLAEKDIDDFTALVHDFRNDRKKIYTQIRQQIGSVDEYKIKNNSLDAIYLERNFLQYSRRIEQITEELDEFKEYLFDEKEAGISVKELYLTSDIAAPAINIKQEYKYFDLRNLEDFTRKLKRYATYAIRFERENYPWCNRKSFKDYGIGELKTMREILFAVPEIKRKITEEVQKVLHGPVDFTICELIQTKTDKILEVLENVKNPDEYAFFRHMCMSEESVSDPLWLANAERVILECFNGQAPERSLKTSELGKFQEVMQRASESRGNLFDWLWWQLASKDKKFLAKVFENNQLKPNKKGFAIMAERVDNRLNLEHNFTKLREKSWLSDIPEKDSEELFDKVYLQSWFSKQKKALQATWIFLSLRHFNQYFNIKHISFDELNTRSNQLIKILSEIPHARTQWFNYLVPPQVARVISDDNYTQFLQETLREDFEKLCEFDTLKENLQPHEKKVIDRILDEAGEATVEEIELLFQNSLRLAWIDHIEIKFPVLRTVSSQKLQTLEEELQECIARKFNICNEILLMKAREQVYQDLEFNRLNNMVTYRELLHQVTKKRKIWPARKLVAAFQNELFKLVPCWMASPESVSTIFSLEDRPIFDLVIFDEASQCFAEKGIPAMYRGTQIVICGDNKQLKPNDLYQIRWEEDEESEDASEAMALEADSLLTLGSQYLMQVQLKGHYRSKSLDLIDFSNRHFYDGTLRLLPDFIDMNQGDPAIKYIKVDGIWKNNANETEARKVGDIIRQLNLDNPEKSIGVITFNVNQQHLIQDVIEEECRKESMKIPDSLFVKNIENVQGDEREIIIFSTGYAPDEKGKLKMRFGSLNMPNGENRLNVAVTRAREKIYIVSSILPEQLDVEKTRNEGPKLLKAYLRYAREVSEGKYKPVPIGDSIGKNNDWFLQKKLSGWANEYLKDVFLLPELPFADLTVVGPTENGIKSKYLGLINTDDSLFYQSVSAKEKHAYLPFIYKEKNWHFKSVYSREYWENPEKFKEDIQRFILRATPQ